MIFFFPESLCLLLFLFSFLATAGAEKWLIPRLAAAAKQPIYEGGPRWHMKKSGTPTMGGIAFLLVATAAAPLCVFFLRKNGLQNESVSFLLAIGYALLNGMLGVLDDVTKIKRKQNAGMTPMEKLLFQSLFTALFLFGRAKLASGGTAFAFSFGNTPL